MATKSMENKSDFLSRLCEQYQLDEEHRTIFSEKLDVVYAMDLSGSPYTRENLLELVEQTAKRYHENRVNLDASKKGLEKLSQNYAKLADNVNAIGEGVQILAEGYQRIQQLTGKVKTAATKLELVVAQIEADKIKSEGGLN